MLNRRESLLFGLWTLVNAPFLALGFYASNTNSVIPAWMLTVAAMVGYWAALGPTIFAFKRARKRVLMGGGLILGQVFQMLCALSWVHHYTYGLEPATWTEAWTGSLIVLNGALIVTNSMMLLFEGLDALLKWGRGDSRTA